MVLFQSFVNELLTLPDLPNPYSLMAIKVEFNIPLIYATHHLYLIYSSVACLFTADSCID